MPAVPTLVGSATTPVKHVRQFQLAFGAARALLARGRCLVASRNGHTACAAAESVGAAYYPWGIAVETMLSIPDQAAVICYRSDAWRAKPLSDRLSPWVVTMGVSWFVLKAVTIEAS